MTREEARRYLGRPRSIGRQIKTKETALGELRASLLPSGIRYDTDKVQTTPEDKLARVMAEIDRLEREIAELKLEQARAIADIEGVISTLHYEQSQEAMTRFYILRQKVADIAEIMHYDIRTVQLYLQKGIDEMIS